MVLDSIEEIYSQQDEREINYRRLRDLSLDYSDFYEPEEDINYE